MQRAAWIVIVISTLTTVIAGWYVANNVQINTDTSDMLSPNLPFRQLSKELDTVFPQFSDNIVIVIDGVAPALTNWAASSLSNKLRQYPELFDTIYDPAGDYFFRQHGLLYLTLAELEEFSNRIMKIQPFLSVLSQDPTLQGLTDLTITMLNAYTSLQITESLASIQPILDQIANAIEAATTDQPIPPINWGLTVQSDDVDNHRRVLTVHPRLDFDTLHPARQAITSLRATIRSLELTPEKGVVVRLTGSATIAEEELESVEAGIGIANLTSLFLVIVLLVVGLSTIRLVLAVLFTLIVGLISTSALALLMVSQLNLISVAFTVLFIGLGVDFGIHFSLRYQEGLKKSPNDAITWAATSVSGSLTLAAVGTTIGFFSFLPTSYSGFAELGLIAGVGMIVALITNLTLLPACLSLIPLSIRNRQYATWFSLTWPQLLTRFVIKNAKNLTWITVLLLILSALSVPAARFDFDPLNLRDQTVESVQTLRDLRHDKRHNPYSITVLADTPAQAQELSKRLVYLPTVATATTLFDYLPKNQDEKLALISDIALLLSPIFIEDEEKKPMLPKQPIGTSQSLNVLRETLMTIIDPAAERLKLVLGKVNSNDKELIEKFNVVLSSSVSQQLDTLRHELSLIKPVTVDDLPLVLRARMLAADGRTRIEVYPKEDLRDYRSLHHFITTVRNVAPRATGAPVNVYESGLAIIESFYFATATTILLLTFILSTLLRHLREVILTLVPLVLSVLLTNAITVIANLAYNFANIIALPLLFSIGVTNGIQFVFRERLEQSPLILLDTTTPHAVVLSALTTIVSFGSLAFSSHPGTAGMGFLLSIAISVTLIVTLFLLPALMITFSRSK